MAISYLDEGHVALFGVTFSAEGQGNANSTMSWTSAGGGNETQLVTDIDEDGKLDAGIDTRGNSYGDPLVFTGYTITVGGTEYPVFVDDLGFEQYYFVSYDDAAGSNGHSIPSAGSSNVYQSEVATYMCFAEDTMIATPDGEVPVVGLGQGDLVKTISGTARIKWIGRQTATRIFGLPERRHLVTVQAHALGEGQPSRDLTLTADHALLVDGVLCNAGALVNGTTIKMVATQDLPERYTVFHIETDQHEIILANGAHAETFIDNVSRRAFDNFAEFEALYGDVPEMTELPYPRAMSVRQVPDRIKVSLASAAAA